MDEPVIVKWYKNCDCDSGSATNATRIRPPSKEIKGIITVEIWFCPMPSCEKCGEPWVME